MKLFLPSWLVVLAALSGLLAAGRASARALPSIISTNLPSQDRIQPSDASSRPNLRFDCFSAADGLSFSLTTSILQDERGLMWFGTRYGLDKYDGSSFEVFFPGPSGDVMGGNFIIDLHQDRAGDLWMSTSIDVVRRDAKTGAFVHYDRNSLTPGRINVIGEDAAGTIWIGTNGGLNRFSSATDSFTPVLQDEAVLSIAADRQGGLWLGTASGVWHTSPGSFEQQRPVQYRHDPADPASLSNDIVIAIHEDSQGALWVGTQYGGLNRLDRASGRFTHYLHSPDDPYSLSSDRVYAILEDDSGRLWIGTQDGLDLLDRSTGHFYRYGFDPADPHSLRHNVVNDLHLDRAGVLWIATLGGVCRLNETASAFTSYDLSDNLIGSIYQDSHDMLWVGTSQGGLNRVDRVSPASPAAAGSPGGGRVTVYRHNPDDPRSISWGEVAAIYEDKAGTLWIGTSGGLNRFDPRTDTFTSEPAFQDLIVGSVIEDQLGNLWVGTWNGLVRRAPGAETFLSEPLVSNPTAQQRVQELYVDHTGMLWISTQNNGLFRLDPALAGSSALAVSHFPQDANDPRSPGTSPVMGFHEDANGALWLATVEDGLVRYDRETQTFVHFMPEAGAAGYISCIQEDAQGALWMGTALGLARFDPASETFAYFDARDGLTIGEGITCFQSEQGEMFFGTWSGLVSFFPDQVRDNPHPPPVVITAVNLNNRPLRGDLLPDALIKLSYRENHLSFDFAALDYAVPAKNQYAYRMEGLDADWVAAGTRRHADYPDLKPGSYTFRVKASNNSGVWNEQGAAARITITPPFWGTWWFLTLSGVALAGAVAGGVRLRLKGVEARSRDLERQVAERTAALEQQTLELQQLYERSHELAVLEERSRLARELHDAVTQTLFSASLVAEALPTTWERDPQEGRGLLQELRGLCRGALAEMRTLLLELRPARLVETRLDDLLRHLAEAASGREGIPVAVQVEGQAAAVPPDVHIALYRIAQEALNNIVKHARAHQATVRLCYTSPEPFTTASPEHPETLDAAQQQALNDDSLRFRRVSDPPEAGCDRQRVDDTTIAAASRQSKEAGPTGLSVLLSIRDDGRGFDPAHVPQDRLGLGNMQERAQTIAARLTIESLPGRGTQVSVLWEEGGKATDGSG